MKNINSEAKTFTLLRGWTLMVVIALFSALGLTATTYTIVDTGQTNCYDSLKVITAPATDAAFYGQDGQITGTQPGYLLSDDKLMVLDKNTGLVWQRSPDTDSDGTISKIDKMTFTQAQARPATLNTAKFGGYTDWRLPTIKELYSLMNFKGTDPSSVSGNDTSVLTPFIDTAFFNFAYGDTTQNERIIDAQYASSTTYISDSSKLFGLNLADGRIKGYDLKMPDGSDKTFFVICVRGNTSYGVNSFTDNGDLSITDSATGLMWSKADSGTYMTWQNALAYAQTQNTAKFLGHSDWRLPNAKELQSILDYTRSPDATSSAAINALFTSTKIKNEGGNDDYPFYWTGTTHTGYSTDGTGGGHAVYMAFGRALGWMKVKPTDTYYTLVDIHGAGAQRSDPKTGSYADYPLGNDSTGKQVYGNGPQGDVIRVANFVRLVRDAGTITQKVATPVFSPIPGTYTSATQVTISCATTGATIHYTLDGAIPTVNSATYTNAITISTTTRLTAIAFKDQWTPSDSMAGYYTISTGTQKVATPTMSPASGTVASGAKVTISCATTGTTIFYTTNGTTPSTASTLYSGPITLTSTSTIKAIAYRSGYTQSDVATSSYTITVAQKVATPTLSPASGTFTAATQVTISCTTTGTTIFYTTNGTTPSTASTQYTGAITVSSTSTIKAIAYRSGYTQSDVATGSYTVTITQKVATPTLSPASGTFTAATQVTISCTTTGTTIFYTTNGTTPSTASTQYTGPITVSSTSTIKAIAYRSGYTQSDVATGSYTVTIAQKVATPTLSPASGIFTAATQVTISCTTTGASIFYTIDGSTPTTASTQYTGPITVSTTQTITVIAYRSGYTQSDLATGSYTVSIPQKVATPTLSPASGTFTAATQVTISCATTGTTIFYTTNGTTPSTASTQYTGPITVSSTSTIKAIAYKPGYTQSDIATGIYTVTITQKVATPTLSPASGTFTTATTVTISCATTGATIFYTVNGSTPSTASSIYSGPITVSATSTIKAIAYRSGYTQSDVATGTYTVSITQKVATPVFSPIPGTFTSATQVTITCSTPGATIRYTTNGTTPTATSTAYTGAITISTTTKLTAIAFLDQWTPSGAATGYYIISIPQQVATPAFSVAPGTFAVPTQVGITCATTSAVIRYTVDGSTPTALSALYSTPITVTKTTTINAIAFKSGSTSSSLLTGTYVISLITPSQGVDLMIKTSSIGTAIGEGIVDVQGTQVAMKTVAARKIASYMIIIKNTGNATDFFYITGVGSKSGWYVNFADPSGLSITQKVTGGYGWQTPAIAAGQSIYIRLDVSPLSITSNDDYVDVTVTATSKTSSTKMDQVKATTTKVR